MSQVISKDNITTIANETPFRAELESQWSLNNHTTSFCHSASQALQQKNMTYHVKDTTSTQ